MKLNEKDPAILLFILDEINVSTKEISTKEVVESTFFR
ncbi:Uncharacterised protein [Yersinia pekkanenii]|uniref:Uncharacterized protein n=1 Tax=Yersinia pekkanenii TaxID=1288385 RepID=A0A0T9R677_9GAMM|nr:Uncharacterised protein [Yersinia pekkanenii]CRY65725.1 Uncharacterised protein [Yersinia pekkanenii]